MALRSKLIWTAVGLAATAAVGYALIPAPAIVDVVPVARTAFRQTIDEEGQTRVRDRYVVAAPLAGMLRRITLRAGDPVTRGSTVATVVPSFPALLDTRTEAELTERIGAAEAAWRRAGALVERAQSALSQAVVDRERARRLAEGGTLAQAAFERIRLAADLAAREVAAAQLEQHAAEHDVAQARAALARASRPDAGAGAAAVPFEVAAPIDGAVLRVTRDSEGPVALGAPLLEVGNAADLEIVVDVLSTDAVQVIPGAEVSIERWGRPTPLAGRVRRIEPSAFTKVSALGVEEQRVNVIIDFVAPREAWAALGDGYRVETRIVVHAAEDAVVVPAGALFRSGTGWSVFVVDGGRARLRAVEIARRGGAVAMIASGLSSGESVIVFPSEAVGDGVRVEARRRS
ncbi:MAG: HlyD family efflux transporter periplasmic adaptor subunit [Alphaproteobacteria bacterium]|nr:HlyD family efflux transporter periplasmic adaptor subunit [Alphaproteobacteria bacterium]